MNALAGLMNPAAIGQGVQQAFEAGMQRNALATLVNEPGNQKAMGVLAQLNPQAAFAMQDRQRQIQAQEAEAQKAQLAGQAAQGNRQALAALWGVDWETAQKLSDAQAEKVGEAYDAMGQYALAIDQLPPDQRPAAWDQAIDGLVGMGFDQLAQYRGQYSEQALQSIVARAGEVQTLIGNRRPSYMAVQPGGTLVDVRNPAAVSQFGQSGGRQQIPTQSIGGVTYYQNPETGKWYDNAQEAGGASSNASGGF